MSNLTSCTAALTAAVAGASAFGGSVIHVDSTAPPWEPRTFTSF